MPKTMKFENPDSDPETWKKTYPGPDPVCSKYAESCWTWVPKSWSCTPLLSGLPAG